MCVAWCDVGGARRNPVFVYRRCVHIGHEGVYVCLMCAQYVGLVVLNEDPPVATQIARSANEAAVWCAHRCRQ